VDQQTAPFRILVICTANVCRSPLAADVLGRAIVTTAAVEVTSAGTEAEPGERMCSQSAARAGVENDGVASAASTDHRATLLTADLLQQADLVLALDRTHRAAAARLAPACRPRLFTLRQAAALAEGIQSTLERGELPDGAPPLPDTPHERRMWLVAELDAGRGTLAGWPEGREDIPDDHGAPDHSATLVDVAATATTLAKALNAVAAGLPPTPATG
jgi:protein-tyrosine-phosphatase